MNAEACVHALAGSVRLCLILQLVFVWSLGLVRGERLTASHVFTVPAHSPIRVQPSRFPGIGPSFSKTPVNIFSPQFFHRGFWPACSSSAYNAASGSHGVKPLSLINFWLMNDGQCLHKDPSQMKTSLRMEFLRVPSVRPNSTVFWGRSFCGAPSPFYSLEWLLGCCSWESGFQGSLGAGEGAREIEQVRTAESSPFTLIVSCFLEYMLIS